MSSSPPPHTEQSDPTPLSATPSYDPVGIFWDYENCPPSTNASGYDIADNIRILASQFGAVNIFKAYLQLPDKSSPRQSTLRSELQSCGLSLTDCPHNGKNSVDLMMIVDIMAFIKDNPPPATVILISGDRDFAYLLSTVRWRKYNVVLISNSFMTHDSLTAQASVVYDWKSDILKTGPPSKPPLPGPQTPSSVASPTTPRELDNIPGSDTHSVSPPKERVVPAIQPLTPPPRPPSTAPTSIISPTRATVPLDTSSAVLEATPLPLMAGNSAEAVPANIPMDSTPDEGTVADSDLDSPQTTDTVDEDGFYSPVLSSPDMTLFRGEGDISSSPGRLLLIDEESPVGPSTNNLEDVYPPGTIAPVLQACECKICAKSPALSTSQTPAQEVVGCRQVEPTTPCDTSASLPVAPPSELSPIREVSLNALASTFVPRTPCFPQAEVARSSPKNGAERGFEDLIAILGELLANGGSTPRISTVFSLWRDKKSDTFETVNATRFRAHLQRAVSAGIVAVEQRKDGDGWVTLRRQREADPKNPQHALSQHPVSQSRGSIRAPNDLRVSENLEPQSFTVGQRAPRKNPSIYEDAGVATIRTTGTPPILAANAPPSFAPLVELLKSKQLTSGQPISFSEVFAHLVSTLGYGDFVSLCTSVPGVTTFSEYIDAAVASGLVSLVGGTGASESALVSLRDAGLAQGTGQRSPDSPSRVPATPPPSLPPFLPRSCSGVYKGTSKHAGPSRRSRRSSRR